MLDLDEFRALDLQQLAKDARRPGFPRSNRLRGRFVRPLPLRWIAPAAQLPGAALHVAILLAWQTGMQRQVKNITVPTAALKEFKVTRSAFYRALQALEGAELITVDRRPGCQARITLVTKT